MEKRGPIREWSHGDNGKLFMAFARGTRRERPMIHADSPVDYISVVIYLGPRDLPADCGTSLFRHRRTGLIGVPDGATLRRLGHTEESLHDELCCWDPQRAADWEEIDRIGYRYNRAVLFLAGLFHSATRDCGSDLERGRIFRGFHFGV
jgi:hypothetical protein